MLLSSLKLFAKRAIFVAAGLVLLAGIFLPPAKGEILYWPGAGFPVEGDVISMDGQKVIFRIKRSRRIAELPVSRFTGDEEKKLFELRERYNRARTEKQQTIKALKVTVDMLTNSNSEKRVFFPEKGIRRILGTDTGTTMLQPKSVALRLRIEASALPDEVPVTIKIVWFGARHAANTIVNEGNDPTQSTDICENNIYVETRRMLMRRTDFTHFSDPVRRCGHERVCSAGEYSGYAVIITNETTGESIFETASPPAVLEKARTAEMRGEYRGQTISR